MRLKTLLIAASSLLCSCASFGFGHAPPEKVKVYSIQSDDSYCDIDPDTGQKSDWCAGKVGGVRKQDKEVIPFEKMQNYPAMSPNDFAAILQTCPSSK